MEKQTSLDLFFETGLRHLYKAEVAVFENLQTLLETAMFQGLKDLFRHHREETSQQILRLEHVFKLLDIDIKASKLQGLPNLGDKAKELLKTLADMNFSDRSKGIDGILSEGKELLRHFADTDANEIALISAAQKVEHFEIACYQLLVMLAEKYGDSQVAELLLKSLEEELQMEQKLSEFADLNL